MKYNLLNKYRTVNYCHNRFVMSYWPTSLEDNIFIHHRCTNYSEYYYKNCYIVTLVVITVITVFYYCDDIGKSNVISRYLVWLSVDNEFMDFLCSVSQYTSSLSLSLVIQPFTYWCRSAKTVIKYVRICNNKVIDVIESNHRASYT